MVLVPETIPLWRARNEGQVLLPERTCTKKKTVLLFGTRVQDDEFISTSFVKTDEFSVGNLHLVWRGIALVNEGTLQTTSEQTFRRTPGNECAVEQRLDAKSPTYLPANDGPGPICSPKTFSPASPKTAFKNRPKRIASTRWRVCNARFLCGGSRETSTTVIVVRIQSSDLYRNKVMVCIRLHIVRETIVSLAEGVRDTINSDLGNSMKPV